MTRGVRGSLIALGAAVLLAAASGCAGRTGAGTSAPTTSASGPAAGHTYIATSVPGHPLVPGTTITVFFDARQVSARAGCNSIGGQFRLESGRLVIDQLTSTLIGCPDAEAAQDDWLRGFLSSKPTVALRGTTLTMTAGSTTITLTDREAALTDLALGGTHWVVNGTSDPGGVPNGVIAELTFGADGQLTGNTGCRDVTATWKAGKGSITFGPLTTGKRACTTETTALDRTVLAALTGTVGARADGMFLTLRADSGTSIVLQLK